MLWFKNFNNDFVAKGYSIDKSPELQKIKKNFYKLDMLQFSTVIVLADPLILYNHKEEEIGKFLLQDVKGTEYNNKLQLWQIKNAVLEKINV